MFGKTILETYNSRHRKSRVRVTRWQKSTDFPLSMMKNKNHGNKTGQYISKILRQEMNCANVFSCFVWRKFSSLGCASWKPTTELCRLQGKINSKWWCKLSIFNQLFWMFIFQCSKNNIVLEFGYIWKWLWDEL